VIASRKDAGQSSCSSGLTGASGGEAGWPVKLLPLLAGLMSAGDRWPSLLPELDTSRLAVAMFARCKRTCD
jgi:hypothetical protein